MQTWKRIDYFTSDLHLGHDKEFLYKPRGFNSINEHDETIINNFNSVIKDTDHLYILGDVFLGDKNDGIEKLRRINGIKHIIIGNHDTDNKIELLKKNAQELKICEITFAARYKYGKRSFFLSHYPTITTNFGDTYKHTIVNLHGHTHSKDKFYSESMYNVGLDSHDNKPVSIEEIINDLKTRGDF